MDQRTEMLDVASVATTIVSVSAMIAIGFVVHALMWRSIPATLVDDRALPEFHQPRSEDANSPAKPDSDTGAKPAPLKQRQTRPGRTLTA